MNVHKLFALSSTAVVVAACAGGGSSAPHAAAQAPTSTASPAATTGPVSLGHAPNSTLTIKATPNLVHLTSKQRRSAKTAKAARRRPAFIDAGGYNTYIEVEVTNRSPNGVTLSRYMAAVDVPVVASQTNDQTIPIYLAPGTDTIDVQEAFTENPGGLQTNAGYLLAQGSSAEPFFVSEGSPQTPSITMQMVVYDLFVGTSLTEFYDYEQLTTSNAFTVPTGEGGGYFPTLCVSDNANVYFLPGDFLNETYVFSTNPGNVAPQSGGLPSIGISSYSNGSGQSSLELNPFGGYIASFDSDRHQIFVTATANAVSSYDGYGPIDFAAGQLIDPQPSQKITVYANIEEKGSYDCVNNYGQPL